MKIAKIPIKAIDCTRLVRFETNQDAVDDYAAAMQFGTTLPPIVVFKDTVGYYLGDGWHRIRAAAASGKDSIEAEVRGGSADDALWFATSCNQTNGVRRTNEDKRICVTAALGLKPDLSDRAIAEHCGVSNHMVADVRSQLGNSPSSSRIGLDGKTRKMPAPQFTPDPELEPESSQDDDQDPPHVRTAEEEMSDEAAVNMQLAKQAIKVLKEIKPKSFGSWEAFQAVVVFIQKHANKTKPSNL